MNPSGMPVSSQAFIKKKKQKHPPTPWSWLWLWQQNLSPYWQPPAGPSGSCWGQQRSRWAGALSGSFVAARERETEKQKEKHLKVKSQNLISGENFLSIILKWVYHGFVLTNIKPWTQACYLLTSNFDIMSEFVWIVESGVGLCWGQLIEMFQKS